MGRTLQNALVNSDLEFKFRDALMEYIEGSSKFSYFIIDKIIIPSVRIKLNGKKKMFVIRKGFIEYMDMPEKIYNTREQAERGNK